MLKADSEATVYQSEVVLLLVPCCCGFSTGMDSTSSPNNNCDSNVMLVGGLGAGAKAENVVDM